MKLDFDLFFYCWDEFLKCSAGVNTFLFISKISPITEIWDQNLGPSKIVTFLYKGTCLCYHPVSHSVAKMKFSLMYSVYVGILLLKKH